MTTPTFSAGSGSYSGTQTVTISTAAPGANIYYTTNGTTLVTQSGAVPQGSFR